MASRKTDLFEVVPSTHRQPQIRTTEFSECEEKSLRKSERPTEHFAEILCSVIVSFGWSGGHRAIVCVSLHIFLDPNSDRGDCAAP